MGELGVYSRDRQEGREGKKNIDTNLEYHSAQLRR